MEIKIKKSSVIEKYKAKLNDGKHNAYKSNKYLRCMLLNDCVKEVIACEKLSCKA